MSHTSGFESQPELADLPVGLVSGDSTERLTRIDSSFDHFLGRFGLVANSMLSSMPASRAPIQAFGTYNSRSINARPDRRRGRETPGSATSRFARRFRNIAGPPRPTCSPSSVKPVSSTINTPVFSPPIVSTTTCRTSSHSPSQSRARSSAVVARPPGRSHRPIRPESSRSCVFRPPRAVHACTHLSAVANPPERTGANRAQNVVNPKNVLQRAFCRLESRKFPSRYRVRRGSRTPWPGQ